MKELYELKEKLCDELKGYGKKDMSAGSLDVVDKLAHTIKNLDKIIEAYDDGASGYYPYAYNDGGMNTNRSYRDRPYRGSYAQRRDGMGRYSGNEYSRHGGMVEELRELMQDAPDERTKQEFQRFISKIESM